MYTYLLNLLHVLAPFARSICNARLQTTLAGLQEAGLQEQAVGLRVGRTEPTLTLAISSQSSS